MVSSSHAVSSFLTWDHPMLEGMLFCYFGQYLHYSASSVEDKAGKIIRNN